MQDPALAALAKATGLLVASVDYRLTPEHPHPAGADDCEETEVRFLSSQSAFDAARWLVEKGAKELGAPAWLAIGGESAGAHLSVLALLRLRDRHGIKGAFRAANLVFGGFDLTKTPSVRRWGDRYLVLSGPVLDFFSDALVPGVPVEVRHDPEISPLYAELSGLPPALFTVGTLDPLLDDTLFMHARWRAAGNDATLKVWPESIHGFTAFPLQIAKAANEAQEAFLRTTLT
jgi:acetyl esterase/lipase